MDDSKVQELLLQLISDMSYVKAKLDNIEEQKISSRIDHLEASVKEHSKTIASLEKRNNTLEEFTRNNIVDAKKQQTSVFISAGLAIFGALVSVFINFLI